MASTRALVVAIGFGSLCGGAIYKVLPDSPGGVDLHPERRITTLLDRFYPDEAHLHGCVKRFGHPVTDLTVRVDARASWEASRSAALDTSGCYDVAIPARLLGADQVRVFDRHDAIKSLDTDVHHGDSLELPTIDLGEQLVRGIIRDHDGNPLAGVHVNGDGVTGYRATDDDGEYSLRVAKEGRYELQVSSFGRTWSVLDADPIVVDVDAITDEPITRDITLR